MPDNVLSREFVDIMTRGVEKVEADINRVKRSTDKIGESATSARSFVSRLGSSLLSAFSAPQRMIGTFYTGLRQVTERLNMLGGMARNLSFGGGLGIGGLVTAAARGTVEGQRFADSLTLLTRVLGDAFAPYVRFATEGIINLAQWFHNLDPEIKASAARWALIVTAIAGFVAIVPVVVAGITALVGVLTVLLNPFVGIPVAIAAAVAGFALMTAEGETMTEKMENFVDRMINVWHLFRATIRVVAGEVANIFQAMVKQIAAFGGVADRVLALDFPGAVRAAQNVAIQGGINAVHLGPEAMANRVAGILAEEAGGAAGARGAARGFIGNVGAGIGGFLQAIQQLWGGVNKGGFNRSFDVGFESPQATFERLQKAFASREGVTIQQQQLDQLKGINDGMQKAVAGLNKIGEFVPAVR